MATRVHAMHTQASDHRGVLPEETREPALSAAHGERMPNYHHCVR